MARCLRGRPRGDPAGGKLTVSFASLNLEPSLTSDSHFSSEFKVMGSFDNSFDAPVACSSLACSGVSNSQPRSQSAVHLNGESSPALRMHLRNFIFVLRWASKSNTRTVVL